MSTHDSPLSSTASIAGILTFVYAVTAGILGYLYLLRSYTHSDASIERFYDAFAACALESDLVRRDILASSSASALDSSMRLPIASPPLGKESLASSSRAPTLVEEKAGNSIASALKLSTSIPLSIHAEPALKNLPQTSSYTPESAPYLLDPDSLGRLYSHVRAVEIDLQTAAAKVIEQRPTGDGRRFWDRVLGRGRWVTRAGELEASLNKREALTSRLLVVQMSLASGRMRAQAEMTRKLEKRLGVQELEMKELKERINVNSGRNKEEITGD